MKTEQFLRLSLKRNLGISDKEINKHFKEFRNKFSEIPEIVRSLNADVRNSEGVVVNDDEIESVIEDLKQHKSNNAENFFKALTWFGMWSLDLLIREIQTQIHYAQSCFGQYLTAKEDRNIDIVFLYIHHFIVHVASIDRLLRVCSGPSGSFRTMLFKKAVDLNGIDLSQFRQLRNHLEHFEERLEAWIYLHLGDAFFDMNLIDSNTKGVVEEKCLRLLVCDKDEFVILGRRYSLIECYRQINILDERLSSSKKHRL